MPREFLKRVTKVCTVGKTQAICNFPNSSLAFNQTSRMFNLCSQHMLLGTDSKCIFEKPGKMKNAKVAAVSKFLECNSAIDGVSNKHYD